MENTTYAGRLRYLDAANVDDAVVNYKGLNVYGPDDEKIGDVEGFVIDADAARANYVVIDSGGWFTSRRLLLPIGHAMLAPDRQSLRTDVTRDTLRRLPDYDEDRFRQFTDDELRAFERRTVAACCPDEPLEDVSVTSWGYDSRRHYQQPDWWQRSRYDASRLGQDTWRGDRTPLAPSEVARPATPVSDPGQRDLVTARKDRDDTRAERTAPGRDTASPHLDGRAQPGDVLGIETGGERTGVGDTAEDEDKRRQDAEKARRDS